MSRRQGAGKNHARHRRSWWGRIGRRVWRGQRIVRDFLALREPHRSRLPDPRARRRLRPRRRLLSRAPRARCRSPRHPYQGSRRADHGPHPHPHPRPRACRWARPCRSRRPDRQHRPGRPRQASIRYRRPGALQAAAVTTAPGAAGEVAGAATVPGAPVAAGAVTSPSPGPNGRRSRSPGTRVRPWASRAKRNYPGACRMRAAAPRRPPRPRTPRRRTRPEPRPPATGPPWTGPWDRTTPPRKFARRRVPTTPTSPRLRPIPCCSGCARA